MNLYEYYQSYVLVCPSCGNLWCRSECPNARPEWATHKSRWSVRDRWCEQCMADNIERQNSWYGGTMINARHAPGTALSFDNRELHEGGSHESWLACLFAMPAEWKHREIHLWCLFDEAINPVEPPLHNILAPVGADDSFGASSAP